MVRHFFYAVVSSPLLKGSAIFKDWASASQCCIDKETGKPYASACFKKFARLEDAESFVLKHKTHEREAFIEVQRHNHSPDNLLSPGLSFLKKCEKKRCINDQLISGRKIQKKTITSIIEPVSSGSNDDHLSDSEKPLHIYTDGACSLNGRADARGGYGVFFGEGDSRNLYGPLPDDGKTHTNQRAELFAILMALRQVANDSRHVTIYSDSNYSLQCIERWLPKWRNNGFQTSKKTKVKNLDLIYAIDKLIQERGQNNFRFRFVAAHQGILGNEAADALARRGLEACRT